MDTDLLVDDHRKHRSLTASDVQTVAEHDHDLDDGCRDGEDACDVPPCSKVRDDCRIPINHHKPAECSDDKTPHQRFELKPLQQHQPDYGGTEAEPNWKQDGKAETREDAKSERTCGDGTFFAVKAAYFLLFGGHVSFMPFIPVYLAELGLDATSIGRIRGFEAFIGVFASPMCGSLADKFNKNKALLVTSVLGTALIYGSSFFLPFLSPKTLTALADNDFNVSAYSLEGVPPGTPLIQFSNLSHDGNETTWSCQCLNKCVSYDYPNASRNCTFVCAGDARCNDMSKDDRLVMTDINPSSRFMSEYISFTEDPKATKASDLSEYAHVECGSFKGILWKCTCSAAGSVHTSRLSCFADSNATYILKSNDTLNTFDRGRNTTAIFSLMLAIVLFGHIFSNPSLPLLDATTMSLVREYEEKGRPVQYGRQRIFGTIAWALMAPLTGLAVDSYSSTFPNSFNRYLPAFVLLLGILSLCAVTVSFIPVRPREPTKALFRDLQILLQKPKVLMFLFIMLVTGMMVGFINSFLFLFLAELKGDRLVMGLSLTIMCLSELPFMMFAAALIERLTYEGVISIAVFCYAVRFLAYSLLYNPWLVLPIELLHGVTDGVMWPTCTSFVHTVSPHNTAATMQSIAHSTKTGLGKFIGTLLGGVLYHHLGARNLFRGSAGLALFSCIFYGATSIFLKRRETLKYTQL